MAILLPLALACGCTASLWNKETFAHKYRPATPSNLGLHYSEKRKDVLVRYSEQKDDRTQTRTRGFWLDENLRRVDRGHRPKFVSAKPEAGLIPIPVFKEQGDVEDGYLGLAAVLNQDETGFTLVYEGRELVFCNLPDYRNEEQRMFQVLLTPLAVAGDAAVGVADGMTPDDFGELIEHLVEQD